MRPTVASAASRPAIQYMEHGAEARGNMKRFRGIQAVSAQDVSSDRQRAVQELGDLEGQDRARNEVDKRGSSILHSAGP